MSTAQAVTEYAPAKVNLSLHVSSPKDNGRHDLHSLVVFADKGASDQLKAEAAAHFSLAVSGPFAGESGYARDNLVLKASRALNAAMGESLPAQAFQLTKTLPCAAGIGGGSADAGAALRILVKAHGGKEAEAQATAIAPSLGGDVLACFYSLPG
ncbi:MAG: 4-(cytidine 5'-diphospho)-2-C-methyl-D-erythritol kinase, partial [Pseudomonadota bacterium]